MNEINVVNAAGVAISPSRIIAESILRRVVAGQWPEFCRLHNRLKNIPVLIIIMFDRLGCSAPNVRTIVDSFVNFECWLRCLPLGGVDLISSPDRMNRHVIAAVAEFERDRQIGRTQAEFQRRRTSGKMIGRPASLTDEQKDAVSAARGFGASISSLARTCTVNRQTKVRVCD